VPQPSRENRDQRVQRTCCARRWSKIASLLYLVQGLPRTYIMRDRDVVRPGSHPLDCQASAARAAPCIRAPPTRYACMVT